jgi:hypothetical protein
MPPIRRLLKLLVAGLALIVSVWFRAVQLAPEAKRRKRAARR